MVIKFLKRNTDLGLALLEYEEVSPQFLLLNFFSTSKACRITGSCPLGFLSPPFKFVSVKLFKKKIKMREKLNTECRANFQSICYLANSFYHLDPLLNLKGQLLIRTSHLPGIPHLACASRHILSSFVGQTPSCHVLQLSARSFT